MTNLAIGLAERGWLPDGLLRLGIRALLHARLRRIRSAAESTDEVVEAMHEGPLAIDTAAANAQHYEVPAAFFELVLGRHRKYSCGYWPPGTPDLDAAEAAALELACTRAGIEDGMDVLDLGCGWGAFTLWTARRYPGCRISAVSNSRSQGVFIAREAERRGLRNVRVHTADLNEFQPDRTFDRVLAIEVFEHVRNYARLLERVARWLAADGRLFVHVFCHRSRPYFFEDQGAGDWMARHFFTGGVMPSEMLLDHFAGPVHLEQRWRLGGAHYERTARAWLANLDARQDEARRVLASVHGAAAGTMIGRWRLFFLACAELFGYRGGEEWFVSHSLWSPGAAERRWA